MKIIRAKKMGFCSGVKRAVQMALESGSGSYTLGPLIHNPQMIEKLREEGITKADSLYGIPVGSKVVFRSHGEPPTSYNVAQSRNLEIIDATCPFVKKAQEAAKSLSEEGYTVVIIGDPKHPEVESIKLWGGVGTLVIDNEDKANELSEAEKYGIIAQTTCIDEVFEKLQAIIAKKAKDSKVIRTICSSMKERQDATVEIAKKADTVIVIGGRNSANTNHLKEIAENFCKNVFLVETAEELTNDMFEKSRIVGVTAGASTPDWIIEDVIKTIESMDQSFTADGLRRIVFGDLITGTVVKVDKDEVFLDINYKSEGIITKAEFAANPPDDLTTAVKNGDELEVFVLNLGAEGNVMLSKKKADEIAAVDKLKDAYENKQPVEVMITEAVKGGVSCDVFGIRGFIPASHLSLERVDDLSTFVGQKVIADIIELDLEKGRKKVVLSRREMLKKEKAKKEKELYDNIKTGGKYQGVVSRLTNFGAFIDLGGVEGLLHVSEMAWNKIKHPSDVLNVNDKVEVLVQKVEQESKKISLSLRDLLQDPWITEIEKYKEGSVVGGKVTRVAKFGAFVALDEKIEGLVHVSEISEERVENPETVLEPGQKVNVKILKIDKKAKKISLSIIEAKRDAEKAEFAEFINKDSEFSNSIGSKIDMSKLQEMFKKEQ